MYPTSTYGVSICIEIKKGNAGLAAFPLRTAGRGRTGTIVKSLVFETNASTNSATAALSPIAGAANVFINYATAKKSFF